MPEDTSLSAGPDTPSVFGTPTPVPHAPETPLDVDELLTQGKLVERTARFCIRGDLYAEHETVIEELAQLVDADGNVLSEGDEALADTSRAQELAAQERKLAEEMRTWMRFVRFRAIPSDEWPAFDRGHRGKDGEVKDLEAYYEALIVRCAVQPKLTLEQLRSMRPKLGQPQFLKLGSEAFWACVTGGVDVPKSPAFSRIPTPQVSDRS